MSTNGLPPNTAGMCTDIGGLDRHHGPLAGSQLDRDARQDRLRDARSADDVARVGPVDEEFDNRCAPRVGSPTERIRATLARHDQRAVVVVAFAVVLLFGVVGVACAA
jgi:hypothetical protein